MISGSIVLYKNERTTLIKAIKSFLNCDLTQKLYLIDNSPTNDLKDIVNDDRVEYIFNPSNPGFGAAHNIALKKALEDKYTYHLILNPDIYFGKSILENIFHYMESNIEIGLLMPKILYPDGRTQYLAKLLPKPIDWIGRFFMPSKRWKEKRNYTFEMHFTGYNQIMDVPYLSGCFMFVRSSVLQKVGLFDEKIFMYGEDTDLSRRIHKKHRTIFYPDVEVYHEFHKGSHKNIRLMLVHIKSAVYYFNKWGWFIDKDRKIINKKILLKWSDKL